jgi:hypothetical protein
MRIELTAQPRFYELFISLVAFSPPVRTEFCQDLLSRR